MWDTAQVHQMFTTTGILHHTWYEHPHFRRTSTSLWPEEGATTQYFDHMLPLRQPTVYELIGK